MNIKMLCFIFVFLYITRNEGVFALRNGMIAGPTEDRITVSIYEEGVRICTGTIVGKQWVLTRASCVKNGDLLLTIQHKIFNPLEDSGMKIVVGKFIRSSGIRNSFYDVGMAMVGEDFLFYNEDTLSLPPKAARIPKEGGAVLSGWMTYQNIYGQTRTQLAKLVIDLQFIILVRNSHKLIIQNELCGLNSKTDAGAPLVYEGVLIAIAYEPGLEEIFDKFVRVSTHTGWILDTIAPTLINSN